MQFVGSARDLVIPAPQSGCTGEDGTDGEPWADPGGESQGKCYVQLNWGDPCS